MPGTKDSSTIKIARGDITAEFNLLNGQLFSLMRKGIEAMWQGGAPEGRRPAFGWRNSEILMFPVVGRPIDGQILVDGAYFSMTQHGVSRHLPWETQQTSESVTMVQNYNAGQKVDDKKGCISEFPRSYTITKCYSLKDDGLTFTLQIENRSDIPLPYAVGWHPAFKAVVNGFITIPTENGFRVIELEKVRLSPGNVIELSHPPNIRMIYQNTDFELSLKHDFMQAQVWYTGEGSVALEPMTAPSLSRSDGSKTTELASQRDYKTLLRGEKRTFEADIRIVPASPYLDRGHVVKRTQ